MGKTPKDKIARWVKAAGQTGKSKDVQDRVVTAAEYLERTARLTEQQACGALTGIDFSKPVSVVRLPRGVYVQFVGTHRGAWFTHTGLTPDQVGLAAGNRSRRLFTPIGIVFALQSTARSIKDTWTTERRLESVAPSAGARMGERTWGGGTQYFVHDKFAMKEILAGSGVSGTRMG